MNDTKPEDTKDQAAPTEEAPEHQNETISGVQDTGIGVGPDAQRTAMETLPPNHTYRDRVEAQARALGIKIEEGWTLERLMFEIRMQASS